MLKRLFLKAVENAKTLDITYATVRELVPWFVMHWAESYTRQTDTFTKGETAMTLFDLKGVIDFTFDIADDEIDASFYIELDEIRRDYSKEIDVVRISKDLVVCKLTDFLRRKAQFHPTEIKKYIEDSYEDDEWRKNLIDQLTKRRSHLTPKADITDDGGEAVFFFIEHDMYDFLTAEKED